MKGLFLMDLYMIKAYFRTLIAIAVVFIIYSFWGGVPVREIRPAPENEGYICKSS